MKPLLTILLFLTACSSIASGTAVYIVARYSESVEVDSRRYKHINKCFVRGQPDALVLGDIIANGEEVGEGFNVILNPEGTYKRPIPPEHLAYAYYFIAERLHDTRAAAKKQAYATKLKKGEAEDIEKYLNRKYLDSFLSKCYSVPDKYEEYLKPRERVN